MALSRADHLLPRLDRSQRRFSSLEEASAALQRPIDPKSKLLMVQPRREQGTYDWLVGRHKGANASDAEAMRDRYPFKRRHTWFAEKAAPVRSADAPDPLASNANILRGKFYEDVAAAHYETATGRLILDFGSLHHHHIVALCPADMTTHEWMQCATQELTAFVVFPFVLDEFMTKGGVVQPSLDLPASMFEYVTEDLLWRVWRALRPASVSAENWDVVRRLNWIIGSVDGYTTCGRVVEFKVPNRVEPHHIRPYYNTQCQINMELVNAEVADYCQYDAIREQLYLLEVARDRTWFAEWVRDAEPVWRQVEIARITGVIPAEFQPPPPTAKRTAAVSGIVLYERGMQVDAEDEDEDVVVAEFAFADDE